MVHSAANMIVAIVLFPVLLLAGMFVIAGAGAMSVTVLLTCLTLFILAFWALRATRRPTAPWRSVRLTTGVSVAMGVCMLLTLPWPPTRQSLSDWMILSAFALLSLTVTFFVGRSVHLARAAGALLAMYGAWGVGVQINALARYPGIPTTEPGIAVSMWLVILLYATCIAQALLQFDTERALRADARASS